MSLAVVALAVIPGCGSVSGPNDTTPTQEQTEAPTNVSPTTPDPRTADPVTTDPTTSDPTTITPRTLDPTVEPDKQDPAEAMSVDGTMSIALPDDWRYAPELETAYSVFSWTKEDGTQNLSMAPLGPWTQIESPEIYLEQLIAAGNLDEASAVLEGDYSVDGYDGFWMSVEGPGYVANIYYINVNGGIKEITANAFHSRGLEDIDGLVQTIDFH